MQLKPYLLPGPPWGESCFQNYLFLGPRAPGQGGLCRQGRYTWHRRKSGQLWVGERLRKSGRESIANGEKNISFLLPFNKCLSDTYFRWWWMLHRGNKMLFYLGLIWTHPLEKTHSSLPQLPNLKSLQLLEWSEAQEREIRCHVGRWPRGPCPSLCLDKPDAYKAGNPLFLSTILLRAQTLPHCAWQSECIPVHLPV